MLNAAYLGVMRKMKLQLLAVFVFVTYAALTNAVENDGLLVRVFGQEHRLPSGCSLSVTPEFVLMKTRFKCELENPTHLAELSFQSRKSCEKLRRDITSQGGGWRDAKSFLANERTHFEAEFHYRTAGAVYLRAIYDSDVCVLALAADAKHREALLGNLWP